MERLKSIRCKLPAAFAIVLIACMLVPATALATTWTLEYHPGTTDASVKEMPASQVYDEPNAGGTDVRSLFNVSSVEIYDLWIEGDQISEENLEGTLSGGGTYTFDPDTNTLTLTDAVIEYSGEDAILSRLDALTVVLEGENSITGFSGDGIGADKGSLAVEGEGSLTIDSADGASALYASGDIEIDGTTLKIDSVRYGVFSIGNVIISGSELELGVDTELGEDAIYAYFYVTIEESDVTISCDDEGVYADYGYLTINSSNIVIGYARDNGLYAYQDITIEESDVEIACGDDGICAGYGSLTIESSSIVVDKSGGDGLHASGNITIEESDVEIACENYGIYANPGYLTIDSSTITIDGARNYGLYAYYDCAISYSSISVDADYCGLYIGDDLSIDSSDVVVTSGFAALYPDNLTVINGSYVELESTGYGAIEVCSSRSDALTVEHSVVIAQSLASGYCGMRNGGPDAYIDDYLSLSNDLIIRTGDTLEGVAPSGIVGEAPVVVIAPGALTVTFDTQGGSEVADQELGFNETATQPADPTRSGYTFDGWFTDADCTEAYDFSQPVRRDMTLYAKWMLDCDHPTAHLEAIAKIEPTCTEAGCQPYWHCPDCGTYFADEACAQAIGDDDALEAWKSEGGDGYIKPTGHDWSDWEPYDESQHQRHCTNDPAEVEYADHNFGDDDTCDDCGYVKPGPQPDPKDDPNLPDTGDSAAGLLIALFCLVIGGASLAFGARRRRLS